MGSDLLEKKVKRAVGSNSVVALPNDSHTSNRVIRVYSKKRLFRDSDSLRWEEVGDIKPDKNSLFINGDLALRMLHFLRLYDGGGHDFAPYISDPDCHGAAMFSMGFVDYIKRISPRDDFARIYSKSPAQFSYASKRSPVLMHLLCYPIEPLIGDSFSEGNTPHSVVYLGTINGQEICFEKRGWGPAQFELLKSSEAGYGTRQRLYVTHA